MEIVPPHFHKDYKIEERDLIPNGDYVSVIPDHAAPEGSRIKYLSGSDFREYIMLDGVWRVFLGSTPTSNDLFANFLDLIHWNSVDGFTVGGTAGSYQVWDGQLVLSSNNIVNTDTHIYSSANYINICETGKEVTVEWQIANLSHATDFLIRLYLTDSAAAPPSDTSNHFGFQLDYGPSKLYGCTGDGATQTKTDLGTVFTSGNQRTRLKAVCNRGTDVKFYVNGTLVGTNTTNLPATNDLRLNMGIKTLIGAQRSVTLNRVLITKQY